LTTIIAEAIQKGCGRRSPYPGGQIGHRKRQGGDLWTIRFRDFDSHYPMQRGLAVKNIHPSEAQIVLRVVVFA